MNFFFNKRNPIFFGNTIIVPTYSKIPRICQILQNFQNHIDRLKIKCFTIVTKEVILPHIVKHKKKKIHGYNKPQINIITSNDRCNISFPSPLNLIKILTKHDSLTMMPLTKNRIVVRPITKYVSGMWNSIVLNFGTCYQMILKLQI
jgi:hypothetical protein